MKQTTSPPNGSSEAQKWDSYYREFAGKNDRATAIVGAAMLESALEKAIQHNSDAKTASRKKLKDLNAKIDEAYRLGVVSEIQKQDLHSIRSIRNYFAHELSASSFEEAAIREQCEGLQIGRRFLSSKGFTIRELFAVTVAALMYWLSTRSLPSPTSEELSNDHDH